MALDLENYVQISDRITEFYQDHPDGTIRTFIVHRDGPEVTVEARVYCTREDARDGIYTSGHAREVEGKGGGANKNAHVENAETSAIGRALAALGYPTKADLPRRTELLRIGRVRREHAALVDYIREVAPKLPAGLIGTIYGTEADLREHVRDQWGAIKESYTAARAAADAIEEATGVDRG
jgi:hypothetical protein